VKPLLLIFTIYKNIVDMKAVSYSKHGVQSPLLLSTAFPFPKARNGELIVKIFAAGLNVRDLKIHDNEIPNFIIPLPKIIGTDFCGIVFSTDQIPNTPYKVGTRVIGMIDVLYTHAGTVAEYVAINESYLAIAPPSLSAVNCAAIPCTALTVVQGLAEFLESTNYQTSHKRILIQGGAGGVGSTAVQYCKKILNMYVIATCSTNNVDFVKELGADEVIDYTKQAFEEVATNCDVVFDCQSYLYEKRTLTGDILKKHGWYINVPSSPNNLRGEYQDPLNIAIPESRIDNYLVGKTREFVNKLGNAINFSSYHYKFFYVTPNGSQLATMATYYDQKLMIPVINKVYKMSECTEAFKHLATGHTRGKTVVTVVE
jgi:alcohol dehydrogenase